MSELRTSVGLAFLSATPALAPARSPLAGAAARSGARLGERGGWELAIAFARPEEEARAIRESVALADAAPLSVLELPDGEPDRREGTWLCPVGADRLLAIGPADGAVGGDGLDVSGAYAGLRLLGPLARDAIARFCALDLRPHVSPPGSFRPGSVARQPGMIVVEGPERFLLLFGWAVGEYVWTVVEDAARSLGGAPAGIEALVEAVARA